MNGTEEAATSADVLKESRVRSSAQRAVARFFRLLGFQRNGDTLERGSDAIELNRNEADALG